MAGPAASLPPTSIADRVEIAPGVMMPRLGLGTSHALGDDVVGEIDAGFELGYRLIDTAAIYGNETDIGRALSATDVPRDEIFVTTKVWNSDQGYERALRAFEASRRRLGLEYVDLYLIHWPQPAQTAATWRALEKLRHDGFVRAIGVCNFEPKHFTALLDAATVPPALDQVELHPGMRRADVVAFCAQNDITVQAWAPIMRGRVGGMPELAQIAAGKGKTPAQVAIRWILQQGITTIPKSVHPTRLAEDADVFDFELTAAEMAAIDALDAGGGAGRLVHTLARQLGRVRKPRG